MKHDRRDFLKVVTSGVLTASLAPLGVSGEEAAQEQDTEEAPQMSRDEKALSLMQKYGSCCSGVFAAYASEAGMDQDLAGFTGKGMAGGIGGLGKVCGAVSAAAMVIGLKTADKDDVNPMETGFKAMETVREFVRRFEEQYSSVQCMDLIGYDISSREKSALAMKENAFARCPEYVASAVKILDNLLGGE